MSQEKITEAIKSAINHLESSTKNTSKGNEKNISGLVWRAAADLEYALFLFSIMHQDESESSSWRVGLHSKEVEIASVLASTRDLLEEAESKIKTGELREAHEKTWMARGYLLRLQEFFEKRRKEREKSTQKSS